MFVKVALAMKVAAAVAALINLNIQFSTTLIQSSSGESIIPLRLHRFFHLLQDGFDIKSRKLRLINQQRKWLQEARLLKTCTLITNFKKLQL